MRVSVLICTYNRPQLLDQVLASVVVQTDEKPDEVVVVNGGTSEADHVVERYIGINDVDVRLIRTKNINLATSRNIGLQECRGDVVAMTDDDAEVFPDWIRELKRSHGEHPEAGAVGGPVFGAGGNNLVTLVADAITFPHWEGLQDVRTLPGVNVSYKREVLQEVGLQDVTLFRGEDVDFNWRVKRLGYQILFDPKVRVKHYHRATLRGFLHQHYMYGRAYYLVRQKWPEMYCLYPHRLRTPKDVLRSVNFFASQFYTPFVMARRVDGRLHRLAALPLLGAAGIAWRYGVFRQLLIERASGADRPVALEEK